MRERVNSDSFSSRRCRVALLGFGTVGSAVARRLTSASAPSQLQLTHIFDRRAVEKRARQIVEQPSVVGQSPGTLCDRNIVWTDRVEDVLYGDADVVVEAIGGIDPAAEWIRASLAAGKSVVTANKQVVARDGAQLLTLAARQGRQLRFEGAVGGAMPIVRAIGDGLAGDRITRIVAILNGTTNDVLSRMEETGCTLTDALREARARGYAELDPSSDLDGHDARAKLAILCALAFGLRVDPARIPARSASSIAPDEIVAARTRGSAIRQLAHADYDVTSSLLTAWVAPVEVPQGSIFGRTKGAQNAALITGEHSGTTGIFGVGAGGDATAVAIISDLAAVARDKAAIVPALTLNADFRLQTSDLRLHTSELGVAC